MKVGFMTTTNKLVLAIAIVLTTGFAEAKEIVINKSTKEVIPADYIGVFPTIEWNKLEDRYDQGKKEESDFMVMMCDDTYYSVAEIRFHGQVGKDVTVDAEGCELDGFWSNGWETVLHFDGPAESCTIRVQKKQNGKKINMNYELSDAC